MSRVRLPTRGRDWRLMARTARLVVTIPLYAVVTFVGAFFGLTLFVFSLNPDLVGFALFSGTLPLENQLALLSGLYPFVSDSFDLLVGSILVLIALLFGVDIAMVTYHLREHDLSVRQGSSGVAGLVLGTLGAGCAACGSVLIVGLLSLFGISVSLSFLPLDGLEFALLALVTLLLSIYWIAEGMRGGEINGCPVDF
ncbi:hypothetical protein [Haladaptatus sp. ZSTT2]|uniref:hypothetical protein n=1 Tax=Haladaptatus sp. ZSTT2 TaxID=3120515 RepID=UPI00300F3929